MHDHIPGQPYELTREQFVAFLGATEIYRSLLPVFEGHRAEQRAFWGTLAAFEAFREFNPFAGCCGSDLTMDTHGDEPGCMRWRYWSTSGTLFEAFEPREYSTGEECMDLPPPAFTVTIPAERDVPGRYHHDRLASGDTYCD